MQTLIQDLHNGIRVLVKQPGFTAVAVIALAVGIGANTTIFSIVKAALLRPLPYQNPEQLVMLWENDTREGNDRNSVAPANFTDWRTQNEVCSQLAYYGQPSGTNVTGSGEPERIIGSGVSANIFSLLGVQPVLGRTFMPFVGQNSQDRETIISHGLWQRRFGGDAGVLGRALTLDGYAYTIVGVMPPDFRLPRESEMNFRLPEESEFWVQTRNGDLPIRNRFFLRVIGRLKPGITIQQAQTGFTTIAKRLEQQYPDTNKGRGINVVSFHDQFFGDMQPALVMIFVAVGFVLLIACANVANLLLVRAAGRQREIAIRTALGAGRGRLIRQLLTESLMLALAGGAGGVLLTLWGVDLLTTLGAAKVVEAEKIKIDVGVFGFTFAVSLLTGLICGIAPAWQVSKPNLPNLYAVLKEGGRSSDDSLSRRRLRGLLVVSEIALALMLLIGAGLMIKSFARLMTVAPGFDPGNVLTLQLSLSDLKYDNNEKISAGYQQIIERISTVPGVSSVGAISRMPLAGDRASSGMRIEGREERPGERAEVHYRVVTPGYFPTLGISLRGGREFNERDTRDTPGVVAINESAARKYWPNEDPIGRRIRLGPNPNAPWQSIIGVVSDAHNFGLDTDARPEVYVSYLQSPSDRMRLVIRTSTEPLNFISAIRAAVHAVDKDLPLAQVMTMDELLARSIGKQRLTLFLLVFFAAVALSLAAVGVYGVMSYSVAQRTHEIGVRIALGAQTRDVLRLVIRQGMMWALSGVAIGLVGALALTRLMRGLLFGVSATDIATFAIVAFLLTGVALLACWLPARWATRVDPMVALRYE